MPAPGLAPALGLAILAILASLAACAASGQGGFASGPDAGVDGGSPYNGTTEMADASVPGTFEPGSATRDASVTEGSACASSVEQAEPQLLPVDIIWMVDNSASMQPAVAEVTAGLNAFAVSIGAKQLDYKVVMLSLRGSESPVQVAGSARYPVCIPPPLAGNASCGNGPRFFHASLDVKSTQPLEQLLGTLGQTQGYAEGASRGGEPWAAELRAGATKTIVVVTDDNSRLSATDFEQFAGGANPNSGSLVLPPGLLHPSRNGAFDGYVFSALYGYGSATDPSVKCTFPNGASPASAGGTYTTLVQRTSGPRAKLCDDRAAWAPFFDAVAQSVARSAKIACELTIPPPSTGVLDPARVNVAFESGTGQTTRILKTDGAGTCGGDVAWYYDRDVAPTRVILCPEACALAQTTVGAGKAGRVQVLFGCQTEVK